MSSLLERAITEHYYLQYSLLCNILRLQGSTALYPLPPITPVAGYQQRPLAAQPIDIQIEQLIWCV